MKTLADLTFQYLSPALLVVVAWFMMLAVGLGIRCFILRGTAAAQVSEPLEAALVVVFLLLAHAVMGMWTYG